MKTDEKETEMQKWNAVRLFLAFKHARLQEKHAVSVSVKNEQVHVI